MKDKNLTLILLVLFLLSLGAAHAITIGPVETIGHPGGTVPDPAASLQWQPYIPDGPATTWPIVLIIHGGGFKDGNMFQPTFLVDTATELARNGFLALSINYRQDMPAGFVPGQTTNGHYPQGSDDVKTAVTAAYADSRWNSTKIFAAGGSGGSSFALMIAGSGTIGVDKVSGAICMSGIYDFTDRTADPDNPTSINILAADVRRYSGVPDDTGGNLAIMLADSPITAIDPTISKLFIVRGTAETIPPAQATDLITKLTGSPFNKVEGTDFIQVHDATPTHAFANWQYINTAAIAFLNDILAGGGLPPPSINGYITFKRQ